MSSEPIQKLHMIILMQPDLQAAIDFYEQLGLKQIFHIKDKWAEMKLGDIKVGLCPTSQSMEGHRTGFVFEVPDVKQIYQELKDCVIFLDEPKEAVHGLMVSFKDPGGNIIDLYQPTPEKVIELAKKAADQRDEQQEDGHKKEACCGSSDACCKVMQEDGIA